MSDISGVRLELAWPNKDKFLLTPTDDNGKPVWVERDHPAASEVRLAEFTGSVGVVNDDNPYADNLLFTGDSLDMLRILAESPEYRRQYRGKVKLVYIDPPFNTGQTFAHYDDFMDHSTWLSFMRDRLILIKELLAPDGVVWVHLDDVESHRMRCLMDEVLGAGNFVAQVAWRSNDTSSNNTKGFAKDHNPILVYGKQAKWRPRRLADATKSTHFKNPNNDPRGPWFDGNPVNNPKIRPNLQYDVTTPNGNVIRHPKNGWRWSEETLMEKLSTGELFFNEAQTVLKRITYLNEQEGLPPSDIWADLDDTGSSRGAKNHLKALFPGMLTPDLFDTPKPESLMKKIVELTTDEGDVVVDCFGGSGSTAVVAHKLGRRWATSEIVAETVRTFTQPRLAQVVAGSDPGGITAAVGWTGGGGFRTVEVGPSMYEVTAFGVMLAEWATNGKFSRAVAAQLGFDYQPDAAPFCGARGRMRLAVLDGTLGPEEVRLTVSALGDKERVTFVAKTVLPEAETLLVELSKGSRIRKAPRDLLTVASKRARRRMERDS